MSDQERHSYQQKAEGMRAARDKAISEELSDLATRITIESDRVDATHERASDSMKASACQLSHEELCKMSELLAYPSMSLKQAKRLRVKTIDCPCPIEKGRMAELARNSQLVEENLPPRSSVYMTVARGRDFIPDFSFSAALKHGGNATLSFGFRHEEPSPGFLPSLARRRMDRVLCIHHCRMERSSEKRLHWSLAL